MKDLYDEVFDQLDPYWVNGPTRLSEDLGVSKSQIRHVLKALVREGKAAYVTAHVDGEDRLCGKGYILIERRFP